VTLGAEDKKKVGWLAGIVILGGGYAVYSNLGDSPSPNYVAPPPPVAAPMVRAGKAAADRRRANHNQTSEFQPRLGPKTPEDRPDPATIDPTLRLDLLAKVQNVDLGAPGRNLFDFGAAPAPVAPMPTKVAKIAVNPAPPPPMPAPGANLTPPPPPPPPITLKYYGYKISSSDGHKAAFLLDGEDIMVAGENDTVKRRYRVVKIGVGSITIEDTQYRNTQTIPIQESPSA
jgi:hypothetical protein